MTGRVPLALDGKLSVWAPEDVGHYARYVEAVLRGVEPTVTYLPSWFRDREAPGARTTEFVDQNPTADAFLDHLAELPDGAGVLVLNSHPLFRQLCFTRLPGKHKIIAFNMRPTQLLRMDGYRTEGIRHWMTGTFNLLSEEVIVRKRGHDITNIYINPDALAIGSKLLVASGRHVPDQIQVPQTPPESTSRSLCLLGFIRPTKGLGLLAEALMSESLDAYRHEVEVIVAGPSYPSGSRDRGELVRMIVDKGWRIRDIDRQLTQAEFDRLIGGNTVQVLPYEKTLGMSGVLGSIIARGHGRVVISDYGWLGRCAAEAGARTFADGSVSGLAAALAAELASEEAPDLHAPPRSYTSDEDFGYEVASILIESMKANQ